METSLRFYETLIFVLNWILPPLMMAATAGLVIWKVRKEHYGEKFRWNLLRRNGSSANWRNRDESETKRPNVFWNSAMPCRKSGKRRRNRISF